MFLRHNERFKNGKSHIGTGATVNDLMVGYKIGGVNVFGGGLPLYNSNGQLPGAIGVSGDSSCADHNIAWKLRHKLNLDYVPKGVSPTKYDNIVYDITGGVSASGRGGILSVHLKLLRLQNICR